mgnify:CR=1 FL=1
MEPLAFHLGEVAHSAKQGIGDTWRAAAAHGYLAGGFRCASDVEQSGGAQHDGAQNVVVVVF